MYNFLIMKKKGETMELKKKLLKLIKTVPTREGGYCDLTDIVDHLIANGVEIPVRCKDCINKRNEHGRLWCIIRSEQKTENDFCSGGKSTPSYIQN